MLIRCALSLNWFIAIVNLSVRYLVLFRGVKMSFYTVIQMCNQTTLYWFSTYWFRASYSFRPLIHSALIGSDVAKQPLN
ncbi:hypothetical protein Hanom_Chr14g01300921 [Helianthus anomalus]